MAGESPLKGRSEFHETVSLSPAKTRRAIVLSGVDLQWMRFVIFWHLEHSNLDHHRPYLYSNRF